jgi:thiamine biosynthesis lipoprotein
MRIFPLLLTSSILASALIFHSCTPKNNIIQKRKVMGEAQGTYYAISYYDPQDRILKHEFDSVLNAFDMSASNYKEQSIISKVNRNEEVKLDSIFIGNFLLAMKVSSQTNGDFDITVRPLVEAWGFGKRSAEDMDSAIVDSIMQFVGYDKIQLESNTRVVKSDPRVQVDFDALAQGYSVDVLAKYLRSIGINSFLIDVGGEIYASESKIDGTDWKVGVETPKDSAAYGDDLSAILPLKNQGLATSGNYRKFYIKDGIKYAHTIDPHSGYPIASRLLSTTVIANTAAEADAYATSFMVMGLEKSIDFVSNHPELEVFLIYSDNDGNYKYFTTPKLAQVIED